MLMSMLVHIHFNQDTVHIHNISLLHIIIGRLICTIGILGHPGILKIGSFSIHIPVAIAYDSASCMDTRDCGDQDAASFHAVSLLPVHIGRTQCIRDIPCHTRFIVTGVDGCL